MPLFIFGLIVAVLAVGGLAFALLARPRAREGTPGPMYGGIAVAAAGIIVAVLCIFFSTYRSVGAREVGVQNSFGKIGPPLTSGVHFTAPWVRVVTCPLTEEYTIQNGDPHTGDALYNQSVPIAGSDGGSATADVTVAYHIDSRDVDTVYRLYACNLTKIKDNAVAQRVRSDVATAATQYVSTDLRANRQGIEKGALALLQQELAPQGISVDTVTLADMQLSKTAQDAADNKVGAQNAIGVARQKLIQAGIEKQTALVNADAEKAANAAKGASLSAPLLCEQWIQMIQQSKLSVLNTAGPCGSSTTSTQTPVIVNGAG